MSSRTLSSTLHDLIGQGIRRGHHIGAQVYVGHRADTVVDMAVGETEPGHALTTDHLTLWFSAGKPLTAVAMLQLFEAGQVELDDSVARFVPAFAAHGKDGITLRHLLTHTGGFRLAPFRFPEDDWDAIIEKICAVRPEPRWAPGTRAGYHLHTSWFMLAEIIARIDAQPFTASLRERVLEPLGMFQSFLGMDSETCDRLSPWLAHMPNTNASDPDRGPTAWHTRPWIMPARPGGNAVGPIRDLGCFYEALLAGGANAHGRVLREATVALMTQRHRQGMMDETFKRVMDWGLGVILNDPAGGDADMPYGFGQYASPQTYGHGGSQSSIGMADPAHGLVIAIVLLGMPGDAIHRQRITALLHAIYAELVPEALERLPNSTMPRQDLRTTDRHR